MKCDALAKKGEGLVFLRDLFPIDRERFPKLDKKWFMFSFYPPAPETLIQKYKNQVQKGTWVQTQEALQATGGYILNGDCARFCDSICLAKGGMFAIFIQDKQSQEAKTSLILKSTPDVMKADSVRFEHEKCQVSTDHLFVVITDRDFSDFNGLAENEIVLSHMDHKGLMGESVALLQLFNHHFSFSRRQSIPKRKRAEG